MNKVLAVVVTYNRLEMLRKSITCLLKQTYACDIMIVDNASTDDTSAWASSLCEKNIIYENTGANLGGAGGFSYGMNRAVQLGYDYAWVMDDDALADSNCLEKLMNAADEIGDFGFLASTVLWKDGTLCRMNWQRKFPTPKKRSERHLTESDLTQKYVQIQSATFVSTLFPVSVIKEAGLPISEFFIWCDDVEFTRRISLIHHHASYVVTDSRITHYIKNNEGTSLATDDAERIPRYSYAFRNENYMYRQYGLKGFAYYLVVIAYNTLKVLTKSHDHKAARLKVMYSSLFKGLFFNPVIKYPGK